MTGSISKFVNVQITRQTVIPSRRGFGIFNFVGNSDVISLSQRVRKYASIDEVALNFPTTSEEYKAASIYFSRNPRPTVIFISRWADVASNAELRGSPSITTDIASWNAVTDGEFKISIDGVESPVQGLDFSLSTTLQGIASVVQAGLVAAGFVGATCIYSTADKNFIIRSGTTGATSTISFLDTPDAPLGTDISGNGGSPFLASASVNAGATITQGYDAESITDALNEIESADNTWYGFGFEKSVRDNANAREAAAWAEPRIKEFFNVTNDINVTLISSTTDIAYELKALGYDRTVLIYNSVVEQYSDVAFASYGATVTPGESTWALKALPSGITPSDELTTSETSIVEGKNCNVYKTYIETGAETGTRLTFPGVVCSGEYIDIIRGVDDLQSLIQTNVFNRLAKAAKIAMTDAGAAILENEVIKALRQSEQNSFLADRDVYDENGEYVETIPAFSTSVVPISSLPDSQRANRIGPDITFEGQLAGAIHTISVRGVVTI